MNALSEGHDARTRRLIHLRMIAQQFLITFASAMFFTWVTFMIQVDAYPFVRNAYLYALRADYTEVVGWASSCDSVTDCVDTMCRIYQENARPAHMVLDPMHVDDMKCGYAPLSADSLNDEPWMAFTFSVSIFLYAIMVLSGVLSLVQYNRAYSISLYLARSISVGASFAILFASFFDSGPSILGMRYGPWGLHCIFSVAALIVDLQARKPTDVQII